MGKLKVELKPRVLGLGRLAKELGVTQSHLYRVWTGERRSPRCEAALVAAGVPPQRPGRGRKGA